MMKINYNGKKFKPLSNSDNGEVSSEMVFVYEQEGDVLSCTYQGENILRGHLLGKVDPSGIISFTYEQINKKGDLMTGKCISTPEILTDGRIRLYEKWQWTSGDFSEGESVLEEII